MDYKLTEASTKENTAFVGSITNNGSYNRVLSIRIFYSFDNLM